MTAPKKPDLDALIAEAKELDAKATPGPLQAADAWPERAEWQRRVRTLLPELAKAASAEVTRLKAKVQETLDDTRQGYMVESDLLAQVEALKADNAALHVSVGLSAGTIQNVEVWMAKRCAADLTGHGPEEHSHLRALREELARIDSVLASPSPGAALLERLRALEASLREIASDGKDGGVQLSASTMRERARAALEKP